MRDLQHALARIPYERRRNAHVAFTAHSIPLSMATNCDYQAQLLETCRLVAQGAGHARWQLVFQSRSGSPMQPWLEPDICDHLRELRRAGATDVVVAPIGFISDHMEVLYDLDTEAQQVAHEIELNLIRAVTVGTHPAFIKMIRELILERMTSDPVRRTLGARGAKEDVCPADCCLSGAGRPGAVHPVNSEHAAPAHERPPAN
ncbi:MAG TPA: ferrochelatase [Pyrinomonadaceae bacterium]